MKKMKTRILLLLALLMVSAVGAKAEDVLYAVKSGTSITIKFGEAEAGALTYDESDAWLGTPSALTSATFDASCAGFNGTTLESLFANCSNLSNITGIENLNTSKVESMWNMFAGCTALTSLDLRSFDMSNVKTTTTMFFACLSLATLYVGNWNTANVTDMSYMFTYCPMETLDLSGWNTAKVTNMTCMFHSCSNLTSIFVGDGWTTAAVFSSDNMFQYCSAIVGERGTTFNSSNITADYAHFGAGGYLRNNYLYDDADDDSRVVEWDGKTFGAVKISGRKLKAGHWNTLYLPFDLDADQIAANFPAGTVVRTLDYCSNDGTTLTIAFADVAAMEAGTPYIVHIPAGEDITDPVFRNVVIQNVDKIINKGDAWFTGFYYSQDLMSDRHVLFLQDDKLYYPSATTTVNAFRGFFALSTEAPETTASANIIIDWGDGETTAIEGVDNGQLTADGWYTLQGVKLDGKPTEKGIYIINGKKVAVQ